MRRRTERRQRGVVISEFAIALPLLLLIAMATVDFGRYVYNMQIVNDLAREAAMLVSRGVPYDQTFAATFNADAPLDVQSYGFIIISRIRRQSAGNPTPWIFEQVSAGNATGWGSRKSSAWRSWASSIANATSRAFKRSRWSACASKPLCS